MSFVTYAHEEADGAERLIALASSVSVVIPRAESAVLKHAHDEARHSLCFLDLLECVFPDHMHDREQRRLLERRQKSIFSGRADPLLSKADIMSEAIRINIGEVKNRVHLSLMQRWVMIYAPSQHSDQAKHLTDTLIRDEINHIIYTALVMNEAGGVDNPHLANEIYQLEFAAFNAQILTELSTARHNNAHVAVRY
ncbi:hypothetical protein [Mesorhizobium sp. M0036]|uniref:hypothetical protein n=1 Tax=Mesorhizobium sp. M0036 TaxID=2956853 RepID=UPI00333BEAD0